jgi:23S rRNA (uracil1939-C5)-methyltransferase
LIDSKPGIVADAFRRIGHLAVDPQPGPVLATTGYRTSMRFLVADGQLALRRAASHDAISAAACVVAHPLMADLLALEWPEGIDEVSLRVGAATGERMVVVEGGEPAALTEPLPTDVRLATPRSKDVFLHESVLGVDFRISPASFFQSRHDGASLVLGSVDEFLGDRASAEALDLCCGVGLFAGLLANRYSGWSVTGVESARSSVADAVSNLARWNSRVIHSAMARFRPRPADLVIADPPRSGLAKEGVAVVRGADPELVVLVSCDAACAGRDAGLIARLGYHVVSVTVLDMFPHTHHVEVVTVFRRSGRNG